MNFVLGEAFDGVVDYTFDWIGRQVSLVGARRKLRGRDHRLACAVRARTHRVDGLGTAWCSMDATLTNGTLSFTAAGTQGRFAPTRLEVFDLVVVHGEPGARPPRPAVLRLTTPSGEVECALRAELAEEAAALLRPSRG